MRHFIISHPALSPLEIDCSRVQLDFGVMEFTLIRFVAVVMCVGVFKPNINITLRWRRALELNSER